MNAMHQLAAWGRSLVCRLYTYIRIYVHVRVRQNVYRRIVGSPVTLQALYSMQELSGVPGKTGSQHDQGYIDSN